MNIWNLIMMKVREAFNTHKADVSAHHARYTDAEAAAAMGSKVDDNPLNHDRPILHACRTYSANSLSIANNSLQVVPFNTDGITIVYDYGEMYDPLYPDRILIKRDGIYQILYRGFWDSSDSGTIRGLRLYKNGNYVADSMNNQLPQTLYFYQQLLTTIVANNGDYIRIKVYQNSGGDLKWYANNPALGIAVTMLREI